MNIAILENLGLKEVEFDPGTVLIEKDSDQKNVFVLILGTVEVRSGDQRLAVLDGPGTILGEIAILLGSKPVASVVTVEKSSFYVINDFLSFIRENPDACVSVAQVLASRLIATNNHLVFVKEQLQSLQESLRDYLPAFPDQK
jgi:CRP-like cAMP-binding protein